MKEKIELFVNKMPKFSGNLDAENEVDDYVGGNFDKMAKEIGIDLNDEKVTEDAWKHYSELLNRHFNEHSDVGDASAKDNNLNSDIIEYVKKMPPYTGDKDSYDALYEYYEKSFLKMAKELGINLDDIETTDIASQIFSDALDEKLEQDSQLTSTGSTEKELADGAESDSETTISDSREKRIAKMKRSWGKTRTQKLLEEDKEHDDPRAGGEVVGPGATVSDATMKNIITALTNHRF